MTLDDLETAILTELRQRGPMHTANLVAVPGVYQAAKLKSRDAPVSAIYMKAGALSMRGAVKISPKGLDAIQVA